MIWDYATAVTAAQALDLEDLRRFASYVAGLAEERTAELASEHESDCYESEGEAAYGREE